MCQSVKEFAVRCCKTQWEDCLFRVIFYYSENEYFRCSQCSGLNPAIFANLYWNVNVIMFENLVSFSVTSRTSTQSWEKFNFMQMSNSVMWRLLMGLKTLESLPSLVECRKTEYKLCYYEQFQCLLYILHIKLYIILY